MSWEKERQGGGAKIHSGDVIDIPSGAIERRKFSIGCGAQGIVFLAFCDFILCRLWGDQQGLSLNEPVPDLTLRDMVDRYI